MADRRLALVAIAAGLALLGCEGQSSSTDQNLVPPDAITDLNAWDPGAWDPGHDPGADPGLDPGPQDPGADEAPADPGPFDPGADAADPGGDPGEGAGKIVLSPGLIDFGYVPRGEQIRATVRVRNTGTGTLSLTRFQVKGTTRVLLDLEPPGVTTKDGTDYVLADPIAVAPGGEFVLGATFTPVEDEAIDGELRVWSSDPDQPDGSAIFLIGNRKRVCVRTIPGDVDFGIVTVGAVVDVPIQVEACGLLDLEVASVTLDAAGLAGGLSLDFAGFPGGAAPSPGTPVVIASGTRATMTLRYSPSAPSPTGRDGAPVPLQAQVAIASNAFAGGAFVPVAAAAVSTPCAVPVIDVLEDGAMYVGDLVHLSGSRSVSPFATVDSWKWTVQGPAGAPAVVVPHDALPDVVLPLGAPGDYTVSLAVGDADGNPSCSVADVSFRAIPSNRALVVLSWKPASGAAVTPFAGPDVDLHVLHPNAAGPDRDQDGKPDGWFDAPWDCYWGNPLPDKATWGSSDPEVDDGVALVETSEDGLVAEVVRIGMFCPSARTYRIGAHFYDDAGTGRARATLHVWDGFGGGLSAVQPLDELDLWEAATLACPAGTIATPPAPVVKKNYVVEQAVGAR